MATITVAIGAQTKSWTVSAGDTTRIVNALKTHYGQVMDNTLTPPAMRDRTNAEVFDLLASGFMQSLKDIVKREEGEALARTARGGVTDVVAS